MSRGAEMRTPLERLRRAVELTGELGGLLRTARLAAGLTQGELAARLGVRQEHVARWEAGQNVPRRGRLRQIVAVLEEVSR